MRAGTYPARGYATLELSGLELSFTGAYVRTCFDCSTSVPTVDLPVPDRPQLLYVPYWGLQEPVFLLNSRLTNVCCDPAYAGQSILHSLRSAFLPSSLNASLPVCLGILYQSTSVGYKYGLPSISFTSFSRKHKLTQLACLAADLYLQIERTLTA